ncbi:unnamed protein product, partial [Prorocentrum cordatum]
GGSWERLPGGADFRRAVAALPADILVFCALLTRAGLRDEPLAWGEVRAALQGCVRRGLLSAEEKFEFELVVGEVLAQRLGEEENELPASGRAGAAQELLPLVELAPTQAMMALSDCIGVSEQPHRWSAGLGAGRPAPWRSSLDPAALRERQARAAH